MRQPPGLAQLTACVGRAAGDDEADGSGTAAAFVETAKSYPRIIGNQHQWMLKAALDEPSIEQKLDSNRRAG